MSEAPTLPAYGLAPETQLVLAARQMVAALASHPNPAKRARRLHKLRVRAEAMRPTDMAPDNIINIRDPKRHAATEAERTQAALSALILQAVEAETADLWRGLRR